jgi:hypothetical protein
MARSGGAWLAGDWSSLLLHWLGAILTNLLDTGGIIDLLDPLDAQSILIPALGDVLCRGGTWRWRPIPLDDKYGPGRRGLRWKSVLGDSRSKCAWNGVKIVAIQGLASAGILPTN